MSYTSHGFQLTKIQKSRLRKAFGNDSAVSLSLKPHQLSGPDELMIPKQTAQKVERHKAMNKGMRLTLSRTALKKNRRGGNAALAAIASTVGPDLLGTAWGQLNADTAGQRKIRRRLQYLQGNGVENVKDSKAFTEGVALAQKPIIQKVVADVDVNKKGAKKEVMSRLKDVGALKGKGLSGAGFLSDFWEGFKFGFTNPIGAIELLVNETDRAISGKGQGGGGQAGSGITFY